MQSALPSLAAQIDASLAAAKARAHAAEARVKELEQIIDNWPLKIGENP